jgi:hypothetical protein
VPREPYGVGAFFFVYWHGAQRPVGVDRLSEGARASRALHHEITGRAQSELAGGGGGRRQAQAAQRNSTYGPAWGGSQVVVRSAGADGGLDATRSGRGQGSLSRTEV